MSLCLIHLSGFLQIIALKLKKTRRSRPKMSASNGRERKIFLEKKKLPSWRRRSLSRSRALQPELVNFAENREIPVELARAFTQAEDPNPGTQRSPRVISPLAAIPAPTPTRSATPPRERTSPEITHSTRRMFRYLSANCPHSPLDEALRSRR